HSVGNEMLWKGSWGRQLLFVRDVLVPLVGRGLDYEELAEVPDVISTHTSKSIQLPVYALRRMDKRITFYLRDNFFNWKLSVDSAQPVRADFDGLFHTTPPVEPEYTGDPLSAVYFEGFPEELVFGYYGPSDGKRWSAEIYSDEALYTALFLTLR